VGVGEEIQAGVREHAGLHRGKFLALEQGQRRGVPVRGGGVVGHREESPAHAQAARAGAVSHELAGLAAALGEDYRGLEDEGRGKNDKYGNKNTTRGREAGHGYIKA